MALQLLAVPVGPRGLSQCRGFLQRVLSAAGFDERARYQVTVAANEAVSNAMEHGAPCGDGQIHLEASVESGCFVLSVRDCGEFAHAGAPDPDPVAERGRGFAFMNLLMDDVRLDARPGETVLRLTKWLPGSRTPQREPELETTERNRRIVRELFDAFAERDVQATVGLVDRGVMMEPLQTPVERRTPYLGVGGLRRYLRDLDDHLGGVRGHDRRKSLNDYVVATGHIRARRGTVELNERAAFVLRLREHRVVWAKVYRSEDEALGAAGWA